MKQDNTHETFDVIIVGAGFAGIYMLYKMREQGLSARVLEAGSGPGGTWYWNRYPGARCDADSLQYQFGFSDELQRKWRWTERYATQPEILDYANFVVDELGLRSDMEFGTRVNNAIFDEAAGRWQIVTDRGRNYTAKYCVMATGCLSSPRMPAIPGVEDFEGESYHTGNWPREPVSFEGKRVAVIGTGSSAVQSIPVIAAQASSLFVFQRTPNFSLPAFNHPLSKQDVDDAKVDFLAYRKQARESFTGMLYPSGDRAAADIPVEEQIAEYEKRWSGGGGFAFTTAFTDLVVSKASNDVACEFIRNKIRATVNDPETAELLSPHDHPIGTKRICLDINYFETYNLPHVTLVDIRKNPIDTITAAGVLCNGREYEVDMIVYCTGFDAMTGALLNMDIRGRGNVSLKDRWNAGPRTYLGLSTAGFPNLFMVTGPGSPSVLTNMIVAIEQHVEWIADCIASMEQNSVQTIEASETAQDEWVDHVNIVADATLFPQANSWYVGANIPGKPRVFMPYVGGLGAYSDRCSAIAARNYSGFVLS